MNFYVHWNGEAWFVKEGKFFEQQKASSAPHETWWKAWQPIYATNIEHARADAKLRWGVKGEYWK